MTQKQAGPGGVATAQAQRKSCRPTLYPRHNRGPVRCELHGVNLVDGFPRRCPLATANPLDTLSEMRNAAWQLSARFDRGSDDAAIGNELHARTDVCTACTSRNLAVPVVLRLRRERAVSQ